LKQVFSWSPDLCLRWIDMRYLRPAGPVAAKREVLALFSALEQNNSKEINDD
jgi:hypothetical protein